MMLKWHGWDVSMKGRRWDEKQLLRSKVGAPMKGVPGELVVCTAKSGKVKKADCLHDRKRTSRRHRSDRPSVTDVRIRNGFRGREGKGHMA
jgi:hypothetical protein